MESVFTGLETELRILILLTLQKMTRKKIRKSYGKWTKMVTIFS